MRNSAAKIGDRGLLLGIVNDSSRAIARQRHVRFTTVQKE
jgi:hypothetical protein